MIKPTPKQIIRVLNTIQSRQSDGKAFYKMGFHRTASRRFSGARRARRRMVRLMAEYLGVGEPVGFPCKIIVDGGQEKDAFFYGFRRIMSQDRTFP